MRSARVIVEVMAGLIPEQPDSEFTRRWAITGEEWAEAGEGAPDLLAELNGKALGYARGLMLRPDRLNWVRTDWIWL